MAKLFVMCGIPGSGKSTIAKELAEICPNTEIFSSDDIREELYGDASIQGDYREVFEILHNRIDEALRAGRNAIYDATNVRSNARVAIRERYSYAECISIYCAVCPEEAKRRNANRSRVVPEYVIDRMWNNLTVPEKAEGFDRIIYVEQGGTVWESSPPYLEDDEDKIVWCRQCGGEMRLIETGFIHNTGFISFIYNCPKCKNTDYFKKIIDKKDYLCYNIEKEAKNDENYFS